MTTHSLLHNASESTQYEWHKKNIEFKKSKAKYSTNGILFNEEKNHTINEKLCYNFFLMRWKEKKYISNKNEKVTAIKMKN